MRRSASRALVIAVLTAVIGVGVAPPQRADAYCDPGYQTCLIGYSDYRIPGWYPAAESITIYAITAAYTYLIGRYVRVKPPWYVTQGAGALWAGIEASYITGKLIPGDRIVQRNYEGATYFQSTWSHYRNGVLIGYRNRAVGKSNCLQIRNFQRGVLAGTITVSPGTRYNFYCSP